MAIPTPYDQIVTAIVVAIFVVAFGAGFIVITSSFQMWSCRTERATVIVRMFLPWWPWIDGMLTEQGIRHRRTHSRAMIVFLVSWILGAAVLLAAAAIWQH
ncbi:MAG: hypothetical protein WDN08_19815 [Rhizomicrobium sp.]